MTKPATTVYQDDLYGALEPVQVGDEARGWHLLYYVGAIASMFDQVYGYVNDQDDKPGWSQLVDPDRCPDEALDWLAQFPGVRIPSGLTPTQKRLRIKTTDGQNRGKVGAMIGAAQQFLTGNKTVYVKERDASVAAADGGAWGLTILTLTSETPDSAKVLSALTEQKPGGIKLNYQTVTGTDYLTIRTTYTTYTTLRGAFATYNGLRNNQPGT